MKDVVEEEESFSFFEIVLVFLWFLFMGLIVFVVTLTIISEMNACFGFL